MLGNKGLSMPFAHTAALILGVLGLLVGVQVITNVHNQSLDPNSNAINRILDSMGTTTVTIGGTNIPGRSISPDVVSNPKKLNPSGQFRGVMAFNMMSAVDCDMTMAVNTYMYYDKNFPSSDYRPHPDRIMYLWEGWTPVVKNTTFQGNCFGADAIDLNPVDNFVNSINPLSSDHNGNANDMEGRYGRINFNTNTTFIIGDGNLCDPGFKSVKFTETRDVQRSTTVVTERRWNFTINRQHLKRNCNEIMMGLAMNDPKHIGVSDGHPGFWHGARNAVFLPSNIKYAEGEGTDGDSFDYELYHDEFLYNNLDDCSNYVGKWRDACERVKGEKDDSSSDSSSGDSTSTVPEECKGLSGRELSGCIRSHSDDSSSSTDSSSSDSSSREDTDRSLKKTLPPYDGIPSEYDISAFAAGEAGNNHGEFAWDVDWVSDGDKRQLESKLYSYRVRMKNIPIIQPQDAAFKSSDCSDCGNNDWGDGDGKFELFIEQAQYIFCKGTTGFMQSNAMYLSNGGEASSKDPYREDMVFPKAEITGGGAKSCLSLGSRIGTVFAGAITDLTPVDIYGRGHNEPIYQLRIDPKYTSKCSAEDSIKREGSPVLEQKFRWGKNGEVKLKCGLKKETVDFKFWEGPASRDQDLSYYTPAWYIAQCPDRKFTPVVTNIDGNETSAATWNSRLKRLEFEKTADTQKAEIDLSAGNLKRNSSMKVSVDMKLSGDVSSATVKGVFGLNGKVAKTWTGQKDIHWEFTGDEMNIDYKYENPFSIEVTTDKVGDQVELKIENMKVEGILKKKYKPDVCKEGSSTSDTTAKCTPASSSQNLLGEGEYQGDASKGQEYWGPGEYEGKPNSYLLSREESTDTFLHWDLPADDGNFTLKFQPNHQYKPGLGGNEGFMGIDPHPSSSDWEGLVDWKGDENAYTLPTQDDHSNPVDSNEFTKQSNKVNWTVTVDTAQKTLKINPENHRPIKRNLKDEEISNIEIYVGTDNGQITIFDAKYREYVGDC